MPEPTSLDAFFSKETGRTILKLAVASAIVGALMSALGLEPMDILEGLGDSVRSVYENLNAIVSKVITWTILGATVVVPIWLIVSLPRRFKRNQRALPPGAEQEREADQRADRRD